MGRPWLVQPLRSAVPAGSSQPEHGAGVYHTVDATQLMQTTWPA